MTKVDVRTTQGIDAPAYTAARCRKDAGLKGVVSKLSYQRYRSGKNPDWIMVECHGWHEADSTAS